MVTKEMIRKDLAGSYAVKFILLNKYSLIDKNCIGFVKVKQGWLRIKKDEDNKMQMLSGYSGDAIQISKHDEGIYYKLLQNRRVLGYVKSRSLIPGLENISIQYRDSMGVKSRTDSLRVRNNSGIRQHLDEAKIRDDYESEEEKFRNILGDYKRDESLKFVFSSKHPDITFTNKISKIVLLLSILMIGLNIFLGGSFIEYIIISISLIIAAVLYIGNNNRFSEEYYISSILLDESLIVLLKSGKGRYVFLKEFSNDEIIDVQENNSLKNPFMNEIEIKTEDDSISLLVDDADDIINKMTVMRI